MYLQDYDETLPGYRFSKTGSKQNPYFNDVNVGATTKDAIFVNQLLNPYIKNDGVWRCPSALTSWVNIDPNGVKDAFQSYGGQNSYAVSNYTFRSNNGIASAAIVAPADTVGMVDATYYNALPYGPKDGAGPCKLAGEGAYGQVGGPVDRQAAATPITGSTLAIPYWTSTIWETSRRWTPRTHRKSRRAKPGTMRWSMSCFWTATPRPSTTTNWRSTPT